MNWFKKQLTEVSAWICAIIIVTAILSRTDFPVIIACLIGIWLDETWIKAQIDAYAPSIGKWIDENFN